jgi:hypothetical protein
MWPKGVRDIQKCKLALAQTVHLKIKIKKQSPRQAKA